MAVVREFYDDYGTHVIINDACCTGLTPEEIALRKRELAQAIMRGQLKAWEAEQREKQERERMENHGTRKKTDRMGDTANP